MEETVNLADLESAEIFGGEVMMVIVMFIMNMWMTIDNRGDFDNDFGSKVSVEVEVWDGPPGPRWCHCMRGPLTPDADSCDLWP